MLYVLMGLESYSEAGLLVLVCKLHSFKSGHNVFVETLRQQKVMGHFTPNAGVCEPEHLLRWCAVGLGKVVFISYQQGSWYNFCFMPRYKGIVRLPVTIIIITHLLKRVITTCTA